jgi:hypothetical protein
MRTALWFFPLCLLSGCSGEPVATEQHEVGRYQFYPASGDMPAILLDTVTGCVERFTKLTSVDNPNDVSWVRQYMDGAIPRVAIENGQSKEVPNSRPPQRCVKREETSQ